MDFPSTFADNFAFRKTLREIGESISVQIPFSIIFKLIHELWLRVKTDHKNETTFSFLWESENLFISSEYPRILFALKFTERTLQSTACLLLSFICDNAMVTFNFHWSVNQFVCCFSVLVPLCRFASALQGYVPNMYSRKPFRI